MSQLTDSRPQLTLPGQAAAAPGPLDMSGMYLAHHGFRRTGLENAALHELHLRPQGVRVIADAARRHVRGLPALALRQRDQDHRFLRNERRSTGTDHDLGLGFDNRRLHAIAVRAARA